MEQDENPDPHPGRRPRGHLGVRADGSSAGAPGDDAGGGFVAWQLGTNSQRVVPANRRDPSPLASKVKKASAPVPDTTLRAVWIPACRRDDPLYSSSSR